MQAEEIGMLLLFILSWKLLVLLLGSVCCEVPIIDYSCPVKSNVYLENSCLDPTTFKYNGVIVYSPSW